MKKEDVFFISIGIFAISFVLTMIITMFYVIINGSVNIIQLFGEAYIEIPLGIIVIVGLCYFIVKRIIKMVKIK